MENSEKINIGNSVCPELTAVPLEGERAVLRPRGVRGVMLLYRSLFFFFVFISGILFILPTTLQAATFTVTKTADTNDGTCDADCSLREAIVAANAAGGADTVSVPSGTYVLNRGNGDDNANNGDLDITEDVTLSGAGESLTIIDANDLDRVFHILSGNTATISDVTIQNGNNASGNDGGGINVEGTLVLTDARVTGNTATEKGGGIYGQSGSVYITLTRVTVDGNSGGEGGGIYIKDLGGITVFTDVTVSGNSAIDGGGLYIEASPVTITGTTFTGNSATAKGAHSTSRETTRWT